MRDHECEMCVLRTLTWQMTDRRRRVFFSVNLRSDAGVPEKSSVEDGYQHEILREMPYTQ